MTYEEVREGLTKIMGNPDTATAELPVFLESIKTDYETMEAAKTKGEEYEKRIRDLQDANMRLYLSQTEQAKEEQEEEVYEGDDAIAHFIEQLQKEEQK